MLIHMPYMDPLGDDPKTIQSYITGSVLHYWKVNIYGPLNFTSQKESSLPTTIFSGAMRLCYISRDGKNFGEIKTVLLHTFEQYCQIGTTIHVSNFPE